MLCGFVLMCRFSIKKRKKDVISRLEFVVLLLMNMVMVVRRLLVM
jgi:hypothetical protein